jgi:hypothetical protein
MVFIHAEYINWGPKHQKEHLYNGFSVPAFNEDVLSHDYHLHQLEQRSGEPYCLQDLLERRGIEPQSLSPPAVHKHKRSYTGDSDNTSILFGSDSGETDSSGYRLMKHLS